MIDNAPENEMLILQNEAIQEQSRRVDTLMARVVDERERRGKTSAPAR